MVGFGEEFSLSKSAFLGKVINVLLLHIGLEVGLGFRLYCLCRSSRFALSCGCWTGRVPIDSSILTWAARW